MSHFLKSEFFSGHTLKVARNLLGQNIVRKQGRQILRVKINEVEAYRGYADKASHAHRGKTPRNSIMWGPPGHFYVYLCYGIHWLLNIVTEREGYPAALLVRGAGKADGPGKLTQSLNVNGGFNGRLAHPDSQLWLEATDKKLPLSRIVKLPRIGVDYAGPVWSQKPYRFSIRPDSDARSNSSRR